MHRIRSAATAAIVVIVVLSLAALEAVAGGLVDSARPFRAPEGTTFRDHIPVAMRDGVRLDTMLLLPPGEKTNLPTILVRTPYDIVDGELRNANVFYERLLGAGYALVLQNERGRHFSEGRYTMLGGAVKDGYDTLSWIAAQPWSNGKVGTFGCSSSGENQLALAAAGHPAHAAMIPMSSGLGVASAGPVEEQGNFYRGGVWQQGWFNFFYNHGHTRWPRPPADLDNAAWPRFARTFRLGNDAKRLKPAGFDDFRMHLPMIGLMKAGDGPLSDFETYLRRKPGEKAWLKNRVSDRSDIKVPGLWAEALYDLSSRSAIAMFKVARDRNLAAGRNNQFLLITNGTHCSFGRESKYTRVGERKLEDARFAYGKLFLKWYDHWLKGIDTDVTERPSILAYMAGANGWRSFDKLVTETHRPLTFHLTSRGNANDLDGDGKLSPEPAVTAMSDSFVYDPANPVISRGGDSYGVGRSHTDGAYDQTEIERRKDVLVYTSAPLKRDVAVFGFIQTKLFVTSDQPDTDFTVKLVDVEPSGLMEIVRSERAWNISDTILRMRYREGLDKEVFMKPAQVYKIEMPLMFAANVFKKGHRIRIEVSSSNFPNYARSLNTKKNPYTSTEFVRVRNSVRHGGKYPSRIVLPVVVSGKEE
ncbi:MAG: CocE/NonD family hydrolase [Alphaproteobacteria bacterium]